MNSHYKPLHIAVLMGGPSAEREISLNSGAAVAAALRRIGHTVTEGIVSATEDGSTLQLPAQTELAFLALHGVFGEDGQVQQILEDRHIPYTGCDVMASRDCMDKIISKEIFLDAGVSTPRFEVIRANSPYRVSLQYPVIVKPSTQGSSVGVFRVDRPEDLEAALRKALQFGNEIIVEEFIAGRELTVGILGGHILPIVEIRPRVGFYDFRNKYTKGMTEYHCPARLEPSVAEEVCEAAGRAFEALDCRDVARIDVRLREDGKPFVLEINTLPGMTETSLLPKAAAAAGYGFEELCGTIVTLAMKRQEFMVGVRS